MSTRLPSSYRLPRIVLLSYIATLATGIGVIFSLLAVIQDRYGFPTWSLGLLAGIPFAMTLFGNIWLTPLADRGWERRLISLGCLLLVLSLLWMVFAVELWQWVAARALMGVAEGVSVGAARRVMLSWSPNRHGQALGSLMMAMLCGILIGPVLGGVLNEFGWAIPFLVPAAAGVVVLALLPSVRPGEYERPTLRLTRRHLTALPGFLSGLLLAASNWLYIGVIDAIWSRYMTDLGARPWLVGVGFLVISVPAILLVPLSGRLADRVNPIRLALVSAVIGLPLLAGYGLVSAVLPLLVVGGLHAACWAFVTLPGQAAVARAAPASQAAEAQGLVEAYGFVLAAAGAFAAAPIYEAAGPRSLFLITAASVALTPMVVFARRSKWRDAFG
ncbi:MFS transporter [Candidatus Spongiisocius sp.]|uniref:MFS transporter n=1 Tax=Candidatus Spongiisocius sp. TaxID=3101273 RepID=UPI003B5CD6C9